MPRSRPIATVSATGATALVAPAGRAAAVGRHGDPRQRPAGSRTAFAAEQHAVEDLPEDTLVFLLAAATARPTSCRTGLAAVRPRRRPAGARVQAICDYVHSHITFGYEHARPTRTAPEAYHERRGVCRDFAHLAVAFCRCMNIPARYCTGYLGDIGLPPPYGRWTSRLVRGLSRRPLAHLRPAQQRAAHRPHPDRPRPRRRRRADHPHLRPQHAVELPGLDRRGGGRARMRAARRHGRNLGSQTGEDSRRGHSLPVFAPSALSA